MEKQRILELLRFLWRKIRERLVSPQKAEFLEINTSKVFSPGI
jgi:hypothetical protein